MSDQREWLGIGVVGAGFMGRTYSEVIAKKIDDAKLIGVACGSRAPELAKDYEIEHFDSLEAMLACDDIDAVLIGTPHALHAEQATAAAKAGKHMLIEKPMACSVEECDTILAACKEKNLKCTIAFSQRTRVCNAKVKELLDTGKLGKVLQIRCYQTVPGGMANLPKWQLQEDNLGTLFGHAIHNFDGIRWLTGQDIKTVYAKCRSIDPAYTTEGTSDVLMTLEDGTTAYLFASFQVPTPGFPRMGYAFRLLCEKGLADIDAYGEARVSIDGGDWEVLTTQPPIDWQGKGFLDPVRLESYTLHIKDFLNSIREDRDPDITGWDGRQAVAAALAAYESSRTGQEIVLTT